ncbi:OLC1v1034819C1 [Oldenlandia corymbosa var. corymbosa]|uniref:RING-type E3 ubiquitin transferase n=1 Tax=Oldenlandia corymbosa var. corymbosa TaxID=529605 RepID=A0AAV1CSA5_OLDCO|nr:OLC1v1034819C1 [Oldenlandia corymbosa var. corymbosa]
MGQGVSCRVGNEHELFRSVQRGELETVESMVDEHPAILRLKTVHGRLSALHVAAANGRPHVLSMLLDRSVHPDVLNRHKQTPLMLAAIHGHHSCVERLLQAGANILTFDSLSGRTCLHYAAYYGHSDCLQSIISAATSSPVAHSWGFGRFLNVRDDKGATPLHLAARQSHSECVHMLLSEGALVCASTGGYSFPGSTPLHLAARAGSLDCVRELLAWGADRHQRDSSGRTPYAVALKHKHWSCALLLNPSAPEPLTWPASLKFISELNPDAKALLEKALIEANEAREKFILKGTPYKNFPNSDPVGDDVDSEVGDADVCSICFELACTIEIQECGHQICAHCTLALCCYKKTNPSTSNFKAPVCPFCRSSITRLNVAQKITINSDLDLEQSPSQPRISQKSFNLNEGSYDGDLEVEHSPSQPRLSQKSFNLNEGSSSFKNRSSLGSLGRMAGISFGKAAANCDIECDKL